MLAPARSVFCSLVAKGVFAPNSGCHSLCFYSVKLEQDLSSGRSGDVRSTLTVTISCRPLISVSPVSPKFNGTERNREKKKKPLPLKNHVIIEILKNNRINISSDSETVKEKSASKRPE